ncbi:hypothetical protein PENSPDRAFT_697908 [Peniophora sp. CONT]|nr:hypothetical protein PENSPDRAFT_697908 [Peniophora sp. CONT]
MSESPRIIEKWPYSKSRQEQSADGPNVIPTAIQTRIGYYEARSLNGRYIDARSNVELMDGELAASDRALADFRRHRNSLIGASTCPPEILSTIFGFLAYLNPNYYSDPEDYLSVLTHKRRPRLGWIKAATQVCHSWRAAAFSDGRLWSTVTTGHGMPWAKQMIRLSKGTPLSLDLRGSSPRKKYKQTQLFMVDTHIHRLRRLQILCNANKYQQLSSLCKEPALQLESLNIFVREYDYKLPNDIFAGQMPRLRELYLHNANLSLGLLPGLQLTHLTLTFNEDQLTRLDTAQRILTILAALPDLELLCMKNYTLTVSEGDIPAKNVEPMNLSHLTDLTIHTANASAAILIFCCIIPHVDACVSIGGSAMPSHANTHWNAIIGLFQHRMKSSPLCKQMDTVEWRGYGVARTPVLSKRDQVDPVYERTLVLSTWRDNDADYLLADYDDHEDPGDPDLKLILGFMSAFRPLMTPGDILPWPQPFSCAKNVSLQMSERYPFTISRWADVMQSFPRIEFLRVDRVLAWEYLTHVHSRTPPSLPNTLQTLALLGFYREDFVEDDPEPDEMLANIWMQTRDKGGALREIVMSETSIDVLGFEDCVKDAGVVINQVRRPEWLQEGHEDWDELTEW